MTCAAHALSGRLTQAFRLKELPNGWAIVSPSLDGITPDIRRII
jgi:hypothetical protein